MLFLLGVYLLVMGGKTFISDGDIMLLTARRIVDLGVMSLPPEAASFPQVVRGADEQLYSPYGLGQPLLAAFLYAIGTYVIGWGMQPALDPYNIGLLLALLLPALATVVTAGALYAWATALYRSVSTGIIVALLYGLCTLAFPYTRFFFSEPLFTCCLVLAAVALYFGKPILAGGALGYALATRLGGIVLLPAFVVYALLLQGAVRERFRHLSLMLAGMLPGIALIVFNNLARFRLLGERGYVGQGFNGSMLDGLAGLLFSPGKSVFLYVPILLLLPLAVLPFFHRFPAESMLALILTVATLLQSSLWWIWWGGWGWGPRFLVPLMPFLVLPLGVLLQSHLWRRVLLFGLAPLGLFVNLLGILVDFNPYLSQITRGDLAREAIYLWQPAASPIVAHLQRLDLYNIPIITFQLTTSDYQLPEPVAGVIILTIVACISAALLGLRFTLWQAHQLETLLHRRPIGRSV